MASGSDEYVGIHRHFEVINKRGTMKVSLVGGRLLFEFQEPDGDAAYGGFVETESQDFMKELKRLVEGA